MCKDLPQSRITQPSAATPVSADTKNHPSPRERGSSKDSALEKQQRTRKLWEQGELRERVSGWAQGVGRAQRGETWRNNRAGKRGVKFSEILGLPCQDEHRAVKLGKTSGLGKREMKLAGILG